MQRDNLILKVSSGRWFRWQLPVCLALFLALFAIADRTQARNGPNEVDLELVLAVDVSYSMDIEEQRLQREGYIKALTSPEVLNAIRQGAVGKIAVSYFEWAGAGFQRIIVPWQVIDGPETADAFVAKLAAAPISRWYRTSVSGAIQFGQEMFENNGFDAVRRVMDISGDGPNNHGLLVETARDRALKAGIVINGLPIMINNGRRSVFDMSDLDDYYTDCVIGGPGSFMIAITGRDQFVAATRTKILREIADAPTILPDGVRVVPVNSTPERPKVNCRIGERQWEERYRN
ncbi:MAG: DUF1194 domain-containing protein [Beijerinckiaceae bacterium]